MGVAAKVEWEGTRRLNVVYLLIFSSAEGYTRFVDALSLYHCRRNCRRLVVEVVDQAPISGQAGHCRATKPLFRPLANGVCFHLDSHSELPAGSWTLRDRGHCVHLITVTARSILQESSVDAVSDVSVSS